MLQPTWFLIPVHPHDHCVARALAPALTIPQARPPGVARGARNRAAAAPGSAGGRVNFQALYMYTGYRAEPLHYALVEKSLRAPDLSPTPSLGLSGLRLRVWCDI